MRSNLPDVSTTKSYCDESPQGLLTHSPCSAARSMNRNSAHSPRRLWCAIRIPNSFIFTPKGKKTTEVPRLSASKNTKSADIVRALELTFSLYIQRSRFCGKLCHVLEVYCVHRMSSLTEITAREG